MAPEETPWSTEQWRPMSASMRQIMRRPRSLLMLLAFIALAVVFALFGQWQLSRAVQAGTVIDRQTETVLSLDEVATPAIEVDDDAINQLVQASGEFVPGEFDILQDRLNDGRSGYWVTGHFGTTDGASLAVALGWTADEDAAAAAVSAIASANLPTEIVGRFQQSEAPTIPSDGQKYASDFAVAALINQWAAPGPTYTGYITLAEVPTGLGLEPIYSPAPEQQVQLNFLNLFYAVEWALFALIALYIWYRLIRDVYEREHDEEEAERVLADDLARADEPVVRP